MIVQSSGLLDERLEENTIWTLCCLSSLYWASFRAEAICWRGSQQWLMSHCFLQAIIFLIFLLEPPMMTPFPIPRTLVTWEISQNSLLQSPHSSGAINKHLFKKTSGVRVVHSFNTIPRPSDEILPEAQFLISLSWSSQSASMSPSTVLRQYWSFEIGLSGTLVTVPVAFRPYWVDENVAILINYIGKHLVCFKQRYQHLVFPSQIYQLCSYCYEFDPDSISIEWRLNYTMKNPIKHKIFSNWL